MESRWNAHDVTVAPNGTSRILWTRSDGAAGIWALNASGVETAVGPTYGPYAGWTAKAIGAASDGTSRILWTRSDGAAGLWTMNATGTQIKVGAIYGPYSDSHGMWSASDLGTSSDGTSNVLWTRSDGAAGLWIFNSADAAMTLGTVYGPFAGFTAAALDFCDRSITRLVGALRRGRRPVELWGVRHGDRHRDPVRPVLGNGVASHPLEGPANPGRAFEAMAFASTAKPSATHGKWSHGSLSAEPVRLLAQPIEMAKRDSSPFAPQV